MRVGATRSIKLDLWPARDRAAWDDAVKGEDWLEEVGAGSHWRPKTREKYAEAYGHWLAYLEDEGLLEAEAAPADRAIPARVWAYASWMRDRVSPVTVRIRIEDLKAVLDAIDPRHDRADFEALLRRLPKTPSRDKRLQLREPAELCQLGQDLMRRAEAGDFGHPRSNAVAFRDGLIIALASWRPLRRANLTGLRLDQHLQRVKGQLRIVIPQETTKSGAPINMTWPPELLEALERYLAHWRKVLLGSHRDPGALWISRRGGGPLSAHSLACNIRAHTHRGLNVAISPHRFRDAAATMMAIHDPRNVRAAAAVLGHADYRTTQKHYNLAKGLDAVRRHHMALDALLDAPEMETQR